MAFWRNQRAVYDAVSHQILHIPLYNSAMNLGLSSNLMHFKVLQILLLQASHVICIFHSKQLDSMPNLKQIYQLLGFGIC